MANRKDQAPAHEIAEAERAVHKRENMGHMRFFIALNLSLILSAIGIVFFKAPNHFAFGGASGAAVLLGGIFPVLSVSAYLWIINIVMVGLGLVFLDKKLIGWSIYASFALSLYTSILSWIFPITHPLTTEPMLELFFAVALPAIGTAITFNIGTSTGGTDILALIIKKFTSLESGKAFLFCDGLLAFISIFAFGVQTGLLCILGVLLKSSIVDNATENFSLRKVCTIISSRSADVEEFLIHKLHRTSTLRNVRGGFSGEPQIEIVTVLTRKEAGQLKRFLSQIDPHAFITMTNSSEISGRGFRS